jgi:hypothetical protein
VQTKNNTGNVISNTSFLMIEQIFSISPNIV